LPWVGFLALLPADLSIVHIFDKLYDAQQSCCVAWLSSCCELIHDFSELSRDATCRSSCPGWKVALVQPPLMPLFPYLRTGCSGRARSSLTPSRLLIVSSALESCIVVVLEQPPPYPTPPTSPPATLSSGLGVSGTVARAAPLPWRKPNTLQGFSGDIKLEVRADLSRCLCECATLL